MKANSNSSKINVELKIRRIQRKLELILTKLGTFRRVYVLEKYSPLELNQKLFQFYDELRKVYVSEYECDSLRVMQL